MENATLEYMAAGLDCSIEEEDLRFHLPLSRQMQRKELIDVLVTYRKKTFEVTAVVEIDHAGWTSTGDLDLEWCILDAHNGDDITEFVSRLDYERIENELYENFDRDTVPPYRR